jgi:hypothetical protein
MSDNPNQDSGEQPGPSSKKSKRWWSRAKDFILEKCSMYDIGRNARFENYRFKAQYQVNVFIGEQGEAEGPSDDRREFL